MSKKRIFMILIFTVLIILLGKTDSKAATAEGEIRGYVYRDNGEEDIGISYDKERIQNVKVRLRNIENNKIMNEIITDKNGSYKFERVPEGKYVVEFLYTKIDDKLYGLSDNNSQNIEKEEYKDENLGYYIAKTKEIEINFNSYYYRNYNLLLIKLRVNISGKAWIDKNKDGSYWTYEDSIIKGMRVRLVNADTNEIIGYKTTDSKGEYEFTNIPLGKYIVEFLHSRIGEKYYDLTKYHYSSSTRDSDAKEEYRDFIERYYVGKTDVLNVDREKTNIDIGLKELYWTITGRAWNDRDGNGKRDDDEQRITQLNVYTDEELGSIATDIDDIYLINADTGEIVDKTRISIRQAKYVFSNVKAGRYKIRFRYDTSRYMLTEYQAEDVDPSVDSDVQENGMTDEFDVFGDVSGIDIGLIDKIYGTITGTVWEDKDKNGRMDPTEEGISGITVILFNSRGEEEEVYTTDSEGNYKFEYIKNGYYKIAFYYDTEKYKITEYKRAGVPEDLNSDAKKGKVEGPNPNEEDEEDEENEELYTYVGIINLLGLNGELSGLNMGLVDKSNTDEPGELEPIEDEDENGSDGNSEEWIFEPDGKGYFATTTHDNQAIFCMQMGGKLGSSTLAPGYEAGDTHGEWCTSKYHCIDVGKNETYNQALERVKNEKKPQISTSTGNETSSDGEQDTSSSAHAYVYNRKTVIDVTKHQDVAYILATMDDQEKAQSAIWQTDLNISGAMSWGAISSSHHPAYDDNGLAEEAKAYKKYYESKKDLKDSTNYPEQRVYVDQDEQTYMYGTYKIDYSNGIYVNNETKKTVYFGFISKMKLKRQDGKTIKILDLLDISGKSIYNRDYPMPLSGEEFYVKFATDEPGKIRGVYLEIEITYIDRCEAQMVKWSGGLKEYTLVEKKITYEEKNSKGNIIKKNLKHTYTTDKGNDREATAYCWEIKGEYKAPSQDTLGVDIPDQSGSGEDPMEEIWWFDEDGRTKWPDGVYKNQEDDEPTDGDTDDYDYNEKEIEQIGHWGKKIWKKQKIKTEVKEIDLTTEISGIVFLDKADGKDTTDTKAYNGLYEKKDTLMPNIEVAIYEQSEGSGKEGTLVELYQKDGELRTNPTLTNEKGEFSFKGLNAQKKYYITYTINGQKYENSTYRVKLEQYNTETWKISSKASLLDEDREEYNNKFEEIYSYPENYEQINDKTGFGLDSNKTYKIFDQTDEKGKKEYQDMERLEKSIINATKGFMNSYRRYPNEDEMMSIYQDVANSNWDIEEVEEKIQYLVDIQVTATTGYESDVQLYPMFSKFIIDTKEKTIGDITYKAFYEGQKHINLGLMEREKLDLTLIKDLDEVTVYINNKRYVYKYNSRQDEDMEIGLRGTDVLTDPSSSGKNNLYERNIRETDIAYISHLKGTGQDYSKRLRIFATYKIRVKNFSNGKITANITELKDNYDNTFEYGQESNTNEDRFSVLTYGSDEHPTVKRDNDNYYLEMDPKKGKYVNWASAGKSGNTNIISTTDTKIANVDLKVGEYFDVYTMFELKTEAIKDLLNTKEDEGVKKENYAQIAGYKSYYTEDRKYSDGRSITKAGDVAGLIDRDSRPGDFEPNSKEVQNFLETTQQDDYKKLNGEAKTRKSRSVFEDDADKAPGINLTVLRERRVLKGNVWEDKVLKEELEKHNIRRGNGDNDDSQPIKDLKVQLIDMDRIENNKNNYTDYNTVTDIYHTEDKMTDGKFETATTFTDEKGNYEFVGYVPGNYLVRFIYGEQELLKSDGNGRKVYEGQDYKSTLYDEGKHQYGKEEEPNYWYSDTTSIKNDAQDNLVRRNEINRNNKSMIFRNSSVLNYYENENDEYLEELEELSKLFADTEKLICEVEYLQRSSEYTEKKEDEMENYIIQNVDFGLVERPRQELTIIKDIANIRIISNSGQTIFDAEQKADNLAWIKPIRNSKNYKKNRVGFVQPTLDENLMHGATVKILYNITIENTGEKDYVMQNGDVDEVFYNTGSPSAGLEPVKARADYILDYIDNNIKFNNDSDLDIIDKDKNYNKHWEIVIGENNAGNKTDNLNEILKTGNDARNSLIDPGLESEVKSYNMLIKATADSPLLNELSPSDKRVKNVGLETYETDGEKTETVTLLLTKVLDTSDNEKDSFVYDNALEIIKTSNIAGRRHYNNAEKTRYNKDDEITNEKIITSIPGNYLRLQSNKSDKAPEITLESEPDSDNAERVTILPPYGKENVAIVVIIAIVTVSILGIGIILIKKKVLQTK